MPVLPDLLVPGLDLIVVGTAAGRASAELRQYYAGRGNKFWRTLHEVGLTPIQLRPDQYAQLLDYRIGLTDVAKHASGMDRDLVASDFDAERLRAAIEAVSPQAVAFNGKKAASAFFGLPTEEIEHGRQATGIGPASLWVCSSTSAANGRWSRESWEELANSVKRGAGGHA